MFYHDRVGAQITKTTPNTHKRLIWALQEGFSGDIGAMSHMGHLGHQNAVRSDLHFNEGAEPL